MVHIDTSIWHWCSCPPLPPDRWWMGCVYAYQLLSLSSCRYAWIPSCKPKFVSSSVTVPSNFLIWVFSVGIIGGYFTATGDRLQLVHLAVFHPGGTFSAGDSFTSWQSLPQSQKPTAQLPLPPHHHTDTRGWCCQFYIHKGQLGGSEWGPLNLHKPLYENQLDRQRIITGTPLHFTAYQV